MGVAQRKVARRGIPVFAYHKISQPPQGTKDPFLYDRPGRFDRQLAMFGEAGLKSASLDSLTTAPAVNTDRVVITFDDGARSVLTEGLPILTRHQFRAIQFLVPKYLGTRNEWDVAKGDVAELLMSQSDVKEWLAAGQEIGSHSMSHRNLRHLGRPEALEEISASKKALEDLFGQEVRHFSYPYGAWNESVREQVREAGYQTACTMDFGVNSPAIDRLQLKRIFPLSTPELLAKVAHRLLRRRSQVM